MNKKTKNLVGIVSTVALVVLVIVMGFVYMKFGPQGTKGEKDIVVEVVTSDDNSQEFKINTDAEFLRQALDEKELIEGSDSDFGFFITGVNGRVAKVDNQEWWQVTKSGEYLEYGVDDIAIADGDHYEITLMVGY